MKKKESDLAKRSREVVYSSEQIKALPSILTPQQTADLLQVSINTIYKWFSTGQLDHCSKKKGTHRFINKELLIADLFLDSK